MADSLILPGVRARLVDNEGRCTAEYYRFLQRLSPTANVDAISAKVDKLAKEIAKGGAFLPSTTKLSGTDGIIVRGTLAQGAVTVSLADVEQDVGGILQRFAIDGKGRVVATAAATTDDLAEGDNNLYFSVMRVNEALEAGSGISIVLDGDKVSIAVTGLPLFLVDEAGNQLVDELGNLLVDTATTSLPVAWSDVLGKPTTVDGYGITDAQKIGTPVSFPTYSLSSVISGTPSAATYPYAAIYVTGLTGGDEPCVSDGTNWRRFSDHTIAN